MSKVPTGGPAAISGIIYQLMWCLLRLTRFEVTRVETDADGSPTTVTIVLEPAGGGGDVQEVRDAKRVATQLKARSDEGAWSLQDVITGVFPDLLKAVRDDGTAAVYQFVTEGHIGNWRSAERFFHSLRDRDPGTDPVAQLSETMLVKVGARSSKPKQDERPFWDKEEYSERELFLKVVDCLSRGETGSERQVLARRVWHLLAHFEFCEPLSVAAAEAEIDATLSELVDYVENVTDTRHALLMRLAEKAKAGNAVVEVGTFLAAAGLDPLPSRNVSALVVRGREVLAKRLAGLGYKRTHHVQEGFTQILAALVPEVANMLITGRSGSGKSWHCAALAETLAAKGALVAHVEADASVSVTLDRAMGVLWNTVKGHDATIPYVRAAKRLRGPPPLRVLVIDRVEDPELARGLVLAGCDGVGVRLILGCGVEAGNAAEAVLPNACRLIEVPEFSPTELTDYLDIRQTPRWESIPGDIRRTLAYPLLAKLYCDTAIAGPWRPTSEYELYHDYWRSRLGPNSPSDPTLDPALLRELARGLLVGGAYPWPADHVHRTLKHEGSLRRLRRAGVLAVRADGACEVWHDRLLNWLVASTLVEDVLAGTRTALDVGSTCAAAARGELRAGGIWLGYVPMDTLWLLAERGAVGAISATILTALEQTPWVSTLYTELVPTMGRRAVSALLARLEELLVGEPSYRSTEVASCLARLESPEAIARARELLGSASEDRQSVALHILRRQGDPESLDRLWALHIAPHDKADAGLGYERRMDALAAAVQLRPQWLADRLGRAQSDTPGLPDLVYQLARLPMGAARWRDLKSHLKLVVPKAKRRCLLRCIFVFRDREELEFVRAEAKSEVDFTGDMALAALTRLDPDAAVADFAVSKVRSIIFTRGWHLHPLLAARPEAARRAVMSLVLAGGESWALFELYRGAENEINAEAFDVALDHLVATLRAELASGKTDASSGPLHGPLTFIDRVVEPALVNRLRARKGSILPRLLGEYLLAIGPRQDSMGRLCDGPALRVLQRIGDPSLAEWVKAGLHGESHFGRLDALQQAHKHSDAESRGLLLRTALGSVLDHDRFESYLAVHALCHLEDWDALVDVVSKTGLEISPYPFEHRREQPALAGSRVEALLVRLEDGDRAPGVLLASGLTRDQRFLAPLSRLVAEDSIDRNVLLSAAIALELLEVVDPMVVRALGRALLAPDPPDRLSRILIGIGTPEALDAVETSLRHRFDAAVCAALAESDGMKGRAAAIAWDHRQRAQWESGFALVVPLYATIKGPEPRAYLERLAFGLEADAFGRELRAAGIRGLALLDQDRAFEAAAGALRDPTEPNREYFPRLLMEIDATRAAPVLLEFLRSDDDEAMAFAIADALSDEELSVKLLALLSADDPKSRWIGCVLAARRSVDTTTRDLLRERAVDVDERVAKAAVAALREALRAQGISALVEEVLRESGETRWVALDQLARGARATKDTPEARWSVLAPLDRGLRPLEAQELSESRRRGDQDYRRGYKDRARDRRR